MLAVACGLLVSVGCTSTFVRGGPGFDAGTFGVSGVETGVGGHVEAVLYSRAGGTGIGIGPGLELAGYSTGGDADPIAFTTIEGRYRRLFRSRTSRGPYWEAGSGLGLAWSPQVQRAVLPLQAELGLQADLGSVLVSVGLRERFLGLIGSGSPPLDAFNSVQLIVGLGFDARSSP